VLDHAWDVAQRLAIEVIGYPAQKREQEMQCMGILLAEVARQAGCPYEAAREFGAAMEQTIRGYVSEIEASGGGTVGTVYYLAFCLLGAEQSNPATVMPTASSTDPLSVCLPSSRPPTVTLSSRSAITMTTI
jgi:hypothetical protein